MPIQTHGGWEGSQMIHHQYEHQMGMGINGFPNFSDRIALDYGAAQAGSTTANIDPVSQQDNTVSNENSSAQEVSAIAADISSLSQTEAPQEAQSNGNETVLAIESIEQTHFRFSEENAWDNRHALEAEPYHAPDISTHEPSTRLLGHAKDDGIHIIYGNGIPERLKQLVMPSNDPRALQTQLEVSTGNTMISHHYLDGTQVNEYKSFLWKDGHINPINTPARQEQALQIIYPAIKDYFGNDRAGLISFLEVNAQQGIPGFQRLLDYETGKTGLSGYLSEAASSISSAVSKLNIFQTTPTTQAIAKGPFVGQLKELVSLCKDGKFALAKQCIEKHQRSLQYGEQGSNQITIDEYNCLYAMYENFHGKVYNESNIKHELTRDPEYSRLIGRLQRGTLKSHEAEAHLETRNFAFKSIAQELSVNPEQLSAHDRAAIYKLIDERSNTANGRAALLSKKDILKEGDLATLSKQLDCIPVNEVGDLPAETEVAEVGSDLIEEQSKESILNKVENSNQSTPASNASNALPPQIDPDPEDPKDNRDLIEPIEPKQVVKEEFQNNISLKETKVYRDAKNQITANTERFEKLNLKPISNKDLQHMVNHHTKIGHIARQRSKTSTFTDGIDIEMILDAWEYGKMVKDGEKIFDTGKIIGTNYDGNPTSLIKIALNGAKDGIRTAYPI